MCKHNLYAIGLLGLEGVAASFGKVSKLQDSSPHLLFSISFVVRELQGEPYLWGLHSFLDMDTDKREPHKKRCFFFKKISIKQITSACVCSLPSFTRSLLTTKWKQKTQTLEGSEAGGWAFWTLWLASHSCRCSSGMLLMHRFLRMQALHFLSVLEKGNKIPDGSKFWSSITCTSSHTLSPTHQISFLHYILKSNKMISLYILRFYGALPVKEDREREGRTRHSPRSTCCRGQILYSLRERAKDSRVK